MISAAAFDPGLHHVAAQAVVDDVAAIGIDEAQALGGLGAVGQRIFHQLLDGGVTVDAAGEIGVGDGVLRPRQLTGQGAQLGLLLGCRRVEASQREQDLALEPRAFVAREGQVDAVVGAALGDEAHRAEQRIDTHLHPAALADEGALQQGVVDVVAGIALVAAQVDRPLGVNREVRVDFDLGR